MPTSRHLETCCSRAAYACLSSHARPVIREQAACSICQLSFLVQAKHLTQDQYAMNHPAGRIGRRLTLRVADVMLSESSSLPLVRIM